jgi:hypothetical protein
MADEILATVKRLQRGVPKDRGVFPFQLQAWIDVPRTEQSLRRYMRELAKEGKLCRVGGWNCRRGYRLAA